MILLSSAALAASPPEVGGIAREQVAYDPTRDFKLEDFLTNSVYARAFGRFETDRGDRWFFEGRFQNHVTVYDHDVSPVKQDLRSEGWADLGLGETGWDGRLGQSLLDLRVGALVERWGRLNVLSVDDVLNPKDLREGLLTPPEYLSIPVPMAVLGAGRGRLRSETVLIPFAGHDRLFLRDTNWGPVRRGWTSDLLGQMRTWITADGDQYQTQKTILDNLRGLTLDPDPSTRRALDEAVLDNQLPQAFWGNGEIAERLELTGSRGSLALVGGSLRSTLPETSLNPALVGILRDRQLPDTSNEQEVLDLQDEVLGDIVRVQWPRTWVAGADGSALLGPVQVSAETLWTRRSVVRLPYLRATAVPSLGAGVGLTYLRGSSLALIGEARWVHLFSPSEHPLPEHLVLARPDHVQVAGIARWTLARNRLTLQAGGMFDPTFVEYAAAGPAIAWRANDHVQFELGGVLLIGSSPAPTALLTGGPGSGNSPTDALTYAGGPVSFIQQNDAVTLAVQLVR